MPRGRPMWPLILAPQERETPRAVEMRCSTVFIQIAKVFES